MSVADAFSIKHHYLHRTAKNSKLALGVKVRGSDELLGLTIWGAPVARLNQRVYIELRRMYLPDNLPKNSESRVLAVCARIIHRLFPHVTHLISYADESVGHQGTIYKAAGWKLHSVVEPDPGGGWSKHKRHKRVELGRKRKYIYPLLCRTRKETRKTFAKLSPKNKCGKYLIIKPLSTTILSVARERLPHARTHARL